MQVLDYQQICIELLTHVRGGRDTRRLSRALGYKSDVVKRWERGERMPSAEQAFALMAKCGVEPRARLAEGFFVFDGDWLRPWRQPNAAFIQAMLKHVMGDRSASEVARGLGWSRFAVGRCLAGKTKPTLVDLLRWVEDCTGRGIDWLASFVSPSQLPSAAGPWRRLEAFRLAIYDTPYVDAVIRALELDDYLALERHYEGWISGRLGIGIQDEKRALRRLLDAGIVERVGPRLVSRAPARLNTSATPARVRGVKRFWGEEALRRLEADAPGLYSYKVMNLSAANYEKLEQRHREYFQALSELTAASRQNDKVVVVNLQLMPLVAPLRAR